MSFHKKYEDSLNVISKNMKEIRMDKGISLSTMVITVIVLLSIKYYKLLFQTFE